MSAVRQSPDAILIAQCRAKEEATPLDGTDGASVLTHDEVMRLLDLAEAGEEMLAELEAMSQAMRGVIAYIDTTDWQKTDDAKGIVRGIAALALGRLLEKPVPRDAHLVRARHAMRIAIDEAVECFDLWGRPPADPRWKLMVERLRAAKALAEGRKP